MNKALSSIQCFEGRHQDCAGVDGLVSGLPCQCACHGRANGKATIRISDGDAGGTKTEATVHGGAAVPEGGHAAQQCAESVGDKHPDQAQHPAQVYDHEPRPDASPKPARAPAVAAAVAVAAWEQSAKDDPPKSVFHDAVDARELRLGHKLTSDAQQGPDPLQGQSPALGGPIRRRERPRAIKSPGNVPSPLPTRQEWEAAGFKVPDALCDQGSGKTSGPDQKTSVGRQRKVLEVADAALKQLGELQALAGTRAAGEIERALDAVQSVIDSLEDRA